MHAVRQSSERGVARLDAGRKGWLQVVQGAVAANGLALASGDGLSLQRTQELHLTATATADVLLFDMA